jgi:hypothetical protein
LSEYLPQNHLSQKASGHSERKSSVINYRRPEYSVKHIAAKDKILGPKVKEQGPKTRGPTDREQEPYCVRFNPWNIY